MDVLQVESPVDLTGYILLLDGSQIWYLPQAGCGIALLELHNFTLHM